MATAPQQQKIDSKMHDPAMLNIWTEEARAQSAGDIDKRENLSRKEFLNEYESAGGAEGCVQGLESHRQVDA
jgi:hypothetical protein